MGAKGYFDTQNLFLNRTSRLRATFIPVSIESRFCSWTQEDLRRFQSWNLESILIFTEIDRFVRKLAPLRDTRYRSGNRFQLRILAPNSIIVIILLGLRITIIFMIFAFLIFKIEFDEIVFKKFFATCSNVSYASIGLNYFNNTSYCKMRRYYF